MKTRIEIIQNAIDFLEGLIDTIDAFNNYDIENLIKLLKSADNKYLQSSIDFFKNQENIRIRGYYLIELLTIALDGKRELLEITGDL